MYLQLLKKENDRYHWCSYVPFPDCISLHPDDILNIVLIGFFILNSFPRIYVCIAKQYNRA